MKCNRVIQQIAVLSFLLLVALAVPAQAPPTLQFFMPDGSMPTREIRFTLTRDDGFVQTYFTDSRGKFPITRKEGLRPDGAYTIVITGDGRSFSTTSLTFKEYSGVYYIPVFLRPLQSTSKPAGVVDLAEIDSQTPAEARAAYENANRAVKENRADEAVNYFHQAIQLYPQYFRALNDLGVLLIRLGRLDEAVKTLEQAIALAPHVYYPRLNLATVKTRQGKYKEAAEMLDKLLKENPSLTKVRIALAEALLGENHLDEAEKHLQVALEDKTIDDAKEGHIRYQLGLVHTRQRKYAEAVKDLRASLKANTDSAQTHLQLGICYSLLNQQDEAERALKTAYQLGGASVGSAQFMLGQLYFTQKRYHQARQAFEQYLTDIPQAPNRIEVASVIERIKAAQPPK
jgi:superkiller protein 3